MIQYGISKMIPNDLAGVEYGKENPMLNVPPPVNILSQRKETVSQIITDIQQHTWIVMQGDYGAGKTQLIAQACQHLGSIMGWLSLHNTQDIREATCRLDNAVCLMVGVDLKSQCGVIKAYESLAKNNKSGSIFVIDDLPRLSGSDFMSQRLLTLKNIFTQYGHHIITISNYQLPQSLLDSDILSINVPPFNADEINELLLLHGAPASLLDKSMLGLFECMTNGNGTLLVALARYLLKNNWILNKSNLKAIFGGEYATHLAEQVILRLVDTVDDNSRELLYRLNCVLGNFGVDEVNIVAQIEPNIERPLESLMHLKGMWIQCKGNNEYAISPLVKQLGNANISKSKYINISRILGENIMKREKKNQYDAQTAILYFIAAQEYTKAVLILISVLQSSIINNQRIDDTCLGIIWLETKIPNQVPISLRIVLRGMQIAVNFNNANISYLMNDLNILVESASADHLFSIFSSMVMILGKVDLKKIDLKLVCPIIAKTIKLIYEHSSEDSSGISLCSEFPLDIAVNMPVSGITTYEDLRVWIEFLESVPVSIREEALSNENGIEACIHAFNGLWLKEYEKTENKDWGKLQSICEEVGSQAKRLELEVLWACAQRTIIIINADNQDDIEHAENIANDALIQCKGEKKAIFIICNTLGCQYYYKKMNDKAYFWLSRALDEGDGQLFPTMKLMNFNYLSCIVGKNDKVKSLDYSQFALDYALNYATHLPLEQARAYGELGVARWLSGEKMISVFQCLDEGMRILLENKEGDKHWKALVVSMGHTINYFYTLIKTGTAPSMASDGSTYVAPFRGQYYMPNFDERAQLYSDDTISSICLFMAQWAEIEQDYINASYWANNAITRCDNAQKMIYECIIIGVVISNAIIQNQYGEAIKKSYSAGISYAVLSSDNFNHTMLGECCKELESILKNKSSQNLEKADVQACVLFVLPAVINILRIYLTDIDQAQILLEKLKLELDNFKERASFPLLWNMTTNLISEIFNPAISTNTLIDHIKEFKKHDLNVLQAICYCGISIKKDAKLTSVMKCQLMALSWIFKSTSNSPMIQNMIIIPFFKEYWISRYESQRFRFNMLGELEKELSEAKKANGQQGLKAMFKAISNSLGVSYDMRYFDWE